MGMQVGSGSVGNGADVGKHTPYPEWRRLYLALWHYAGMKKTTKLPAGPWRISALITPLLTEFSSDGGGIEVNSTGFEFQFNKRFLDGLIRFTDALDHDDPDESLGLHADRSSPPPSDEPLEDNNKEGFTLLIIDQFSVAEEE